MTQYLLYLALASYLGATGLWFAYFLVQKEPLCRYGVWSMAAGLACHTLVLIQLTWIYSYLPVAVFGGALLVFDWVLVAAFLIFNWRFPIRVLGALVAPLAALMMFGAIVLPQGQVGEFSPLLRGFWLTAHILLTLAGYAALTLNFLGGVFYLIQERQLKGKRFGFFYRRLPSLSQLDTLNYWCLTIGFPLLTGGIIAGSFYAQHSMGRFWSWDPKEVLTLIAWLIYAVLLHERLAVGWRGRRAAWLAIAGFAVLLVTFVGANLWVSGYHSFAKFGQP
jgi:cytochrome c-type biogenesis protein CcsB